MDIDRVRVLVYEDKPMGLRFDTSDGVFDVDKDTLRQYGIYNFNLDKKLELHLRQGMFVSDEDIEGEEIEDLSDNTERLSALVKRLHSTRIHKSLFKCLQPYEMSLVAFMSDDGWRAIRYQDTDSEYGKYRIVLPDNTRWKGKWNDLHRNAELAKMDFHHDQTKMAIYKGVEISADAVEEYQDLEYVLESIYDIVMKINVKSHEGFEIEVDDRVRRISLEKYPHTRSGQRNFVVANKMIPQRVVKYICEDPIFNVKELTVIALNRALSEYEKSSRRLVV